MGRTIASIVAPFLVAAVSPLASTAAAQARPEPGVGDALLGLMPGPVRAITRTDAVRMFTAIVLGEPPDIGHGWFGPSESLYGWNWFADRFDRDGDGKVTRAEFKGPKELFEVLDRDRDGKITAADFDWSDDAPFVRQMESARRWFRRVDANSNGRVSAAEWQTLFKEMAKGKEYLSAEDLQAWLYPPSPKGPPPPGAGMPTPLVLLAGLFQAEIGSPYPGPRLGEPAPGFRLRTQEGDRTISLRQFRGKRPVVLVFGSFT